MKKVLIIGHFWPYRSGGNRIIGLAKYLKNFGWEPVIITGTLEKKPDFEVRYFEIDHKFFFYWPLKFFGFNMSKDIGIQFREVGNKSAPAFRHILKFLYRLAQEFFAWPDENKYFEKPARFLAKKILSEEKISALISEYPVSSHLAASRLKKEFNVPWIADFVDPWSLNHDYPYSFIRKIFDKNLEKKTIKNADALTTVSTLLAERLEAFHTGKKAHSITNGFDPEKMNMSAVSLTNKFTITYTGQMYVGKRDPEKFLEAMSELKKEGKFDKGDVDVRFYGPKNPWLEERIKFYNISEFVKQCGYLSREEAMARQRESQVLLLLNWKGKRGEGVYTGKIFEYLTSMRPILVTEGAENNNFIEALIEKTNTGFSGRNTEDIKRLILQFYEEYKKNGMIKYNGKMEEIMKYSYPAIAERFANILNEITAK